MPSIDVMALNSSWVNALNNKQSPESMRKLAQETQSYIREYLRERAFSRKILTPKYISIQECDANPYDDSLIKIRSLEPFSKGAMPISYRGRGDCQYIETRKYVIPLTKIESPLYQKDEIELLASDAPITQIIEENAVKDVEEVEDVRFLSAVNQALVINGKVLDGGANITKNELIPLFNLIDEYRLKTETLLMSNVTYNSWLKQTVNDIGDDNVNEMTKNGWVYDRILGKKVVVSLKTDLLDEYNIDGTCKARCIYAFTTEDALGDSYILNDSKLWFRNDFGMIEFKFDEIIGSGFGNIAGIAKLRLVQ